MTQIIPLQAIPNQTVNVQLNGQPCEIGIQQTAFGLFFSLTLNQALILSSVLCQNLNRLVRDLYFGFEGDFIFQDTEGSSDPNYTGLGVTNPRYQLLYLMPSEAED